MTGGKRAKRAADTDPEALEYDAAQPEGAAVSQEDAQITLAAAGSSSSSSRPVAAPVAAPRPVAVPVTAPATVAVPVTAPMTVAAPVAALMTVAAPVAAPATAAGPESAPWHAASAADPYGGGMGLGKLRTQDEALMELHFSSEEERTEIRRWVMEIGRQVHVSLIFSPPRATGMARRFGLTPGMAFDLSVGWDLDREEDQKEVWRHLVEEQPYLIIGSPECKGFSTMQGLSAGKPGAAASGDGPASPWLRCQSLPVALGARRAVPA